MNGRMDFYRTWTEYSAGFGNLSEEFWLGKADTGFSYLNNFILFLQINTIQISNLYFRLF